MRPCRIESCLWPWLIFFMLYSSALECQMFIFFSPLADMLTLNWERYFSFLYSFLKTQTLFPRLGIKSPTLSLPFIFFFKVFHKIPAVSPKDWLGPAFLVSEWSRGPSYRQMLYLNGSWRQGTLIIFFLWRAGLLPSLISIPFSVLLPGPGSPCIKMLLTHLHPEEMWASERHCRIQKCMIPLLNQ